MSKIRNFYWRVYQLLYSTLNKTTLENTRIKTIRGLKQKLRHKNSYPNATMYISIFVDIFNQLDMLVQFSDKTERNNAIVRQMLERV